MPSASASAFMVEAVPMVLQCLSDESANTQSGPLLRGGARAAALPRRRRRRAHAVHKLGVADLARGEEPPKAPTPQSAPLRPWMLSPDESGLASPPR